MLCRLQGVIMLFDLGLVSEDEEEEQNIPLSITVSNRFYSSKKKRYFFVHEWAWQPQIYQIT